MAAKIRSEITLADYPLPPGFDPGAHSWRVVLRFRGRRMTVPFFTGALHGEPTTADVLTCLCMDAAIWENDEVSDLYDNCRAAIEVQRALDKQIPRFRRFLGEDLYSVLVWADEDTVRNWAA